MSAAAIAHYAGNLVRLEPQAVQQLRDATAQARQQPPARSAAERTLEGEWLNRQDRQQSRGPALTEEEYLARHQAQQGREGYQSPAQRAVAAYQDTAQVTHPADVDRIGVLDVYV